MFVDVNCVASCGRGTAKTFVKSSMSLFLFHVLVCSNEPLLPLVLLIIIYTKENDVWPTSAEREKPSLCF